MTKLHQSMIGWPLLALFLASCVTINIYFPAAAAEEAARTIVRDVLKGEESEAPSPPVQGDKESHHRRAGPLMLALGVLLENLVPAAQAAQADININTPGIRAIRSSMQDRQSSLAPFYRSGAIGFDNKGSISVRDLGAVGLADRNRLKKLVAEFLLDKAILEEAVAKK